MENFHRLSFCFDLDGTLIDTAPDLVRVLNEIIAADDVPPANFARARNYVGYGSMALIKLAYKDAGRELGADKAAVLQTEFLSRYADTIDQLSRPFPGVVKTLSRLKYHGAALSICTNKPGWLARPLIEKLGLTSLFTRIIGSDDAPIKKPHPSHVFMAAGHQDNARIIMVGDSRPDLGAAQNAGVISVMMDYGYSPEPVRGMGGDITLSHFANLPQAVQSYRKSL